MRLALVTALFVTATAGSAQALSCIRPDAALVYNMAQAADETYYAAVGKIDFRARKPGQKGPQEFAATLTGKSLTANGFTAPIKTPITIRTGCAGPWCGNLTPGEDYLMVLLAEGSQFVLNVGACPSTTLASPSASQIKTFVNCASGKSCQARR